MKINILRELVLLGARGREQGEIGGYGVWAPMEGVIPWGCR